MTTPPASGLRSAGSSTPDVAPAPLIAGRFQVEGLIAVGGMGSVYRARDVTLDEVVALKMIAREISSTPGMIERFRREVKLARRVTHRNVARCFDIGEDGDDVFFTMELVDGESLGARVAREHTIAPGEAIEIALEVCAGLAAAHGAGVVHRDLKPDNVLLEKDGRVVLTDFGIASARLPSDGPRRTMGIILGTPEYMAPEQVEAHSELDGRADIYSLGAMLYELVTGSAAWTGSTPMAVIAARLGNPPPDPRLRATVGDGLAQVILRCMARHRVDRFANVDALADALRAAQNEETSPALNGRSGLKGASASLSAPPLDAGGMNDERSVMILARAPDGGPLGQAAAYGLGDLIERHLIGAKSLRVIARGAVRSATSTTTGTRAFILEPASALNAAFVVEASLVLVGDRLKVDVRLVNKVDDAVLDSRVHESSRTDLFNLARAIAADVAAVLVEGHTSMLPDGIADPEALDLWLSARQEARTSGAIARDRAVAMFEQAISRAPDDLWILAGYAATLVERFHETETPSADLREAAAMAERVVDATGALGEAWLARAIARFELGDSRGAVTDVARAHRAMPGVARVHSLRGRMYLEAGDRARGRAHLERASCLEPSLTEPPLSMAFAAGMMGDFAAAWKLIDRVLNIDKPSVDALLTAARLALWSSDVDRARLLRRLASARPNHDGRALHVLDAVLVEGGHVGVDFFAWLAEIDPMAVRRSAAARRIEAELAAASGDLGRALDAVQAAVATTGFFDVGWLDGCPLLKPVRAAPRFVALRAEALATRREILELLDATRDEE